MTEKLFYSDSYITEFSATVLSIVPDGKKYKVILDRTAFFPEAGGQTGDRGYIGNARVLDTQDGEDIIHITDKPLTVGESVKCTLDKDERFYKMQNHTGEHLLSGLLHSLYGIENVGFALYDSYMTFDTSLPVTDEMAKKVELLANEAVWKGANVSAYFPTDEELKTTDYRSKGEIDGKVRLVKIENYDICACCAPHLKNINGVGLIKLLDVTPLRGGSRIKAVCGRFALDDYIKKHNNAVGISNLVCCKADETAQAVKTLNAKKEKAEYDLKRVEDAFCVTLGKTAEKGVPAVYFQDLSSDGRRTLVNEATKITSLGICFSASDKGYFYTLKKENGANAFTRLLNEALDGRGGGREPLCEGTVKCDREKIEKFFSEVSL